MASHLLPLTLSVTVVIDVRHAYIITLPALFINPSDYLTVTYHLLFIGNSLILTCTIFTLAADYRIAVEQQSVSRPDE